MIRQTGNHQAIVTLDLGALKAGQELIERDTPVMTGFFLHIFRIFKVY